MPKDLDAMTAEEFDRALKRLGLSVYAARVPLGVSLRQAQRYSSGDTPIPATVALLLRMYLKHGFLD
jgi:hypothetical protein